MIDFPEPNRLQRAFQRFAASQPGAWLMARLAHRLDRLFASLSSGKIYLANLLSGLPVATLVTTGARSGAPRHTPVVIVPDGKQFILVASNFGQAHNPGWYHNLRAHPKAILLAQGQALPCHAREADADERQRCWELAVRLYPGFLAYERRASPRRIPIMLLSPVAAPAEASAHSDHHPRV